MSDPASQLVSDKAPELDDSKCQQIVPDPPSMQLDEELMLADDDCQIVSDHLDALSEDLKLADNECQVPSDHVHVLSDSSEPSLQPLDRVEKILEVDSPPLVEKGSQLKEVLNADEVELAPESIKEPAEVDNLEYCTFSLTNPRFGVVLSNSQAGYKYTLTLPGIMTKVLPKKKVPVVLNSYGKIWTMFYNGHLKTKTFNSSDWRKFVVDNELKMGDGCFFELLENSLKKLVFKVVIYRTHSSPSRDEEADVGESSEKPIIIE